MQLLSKRQAITQLLQDPGTPADLQHKLRYVLEVRDFASTQLALPDNDSYRHYADLGRDYVVWNVFAVPEFSIKPMQWCFVFAGCISYRGYFAKHKAEEFAATLQAQGHDIYVAGIGAYSTLGWFDDPLLNTIIRRSDSQIAALIFHELAHQCVYAKNDTAFNESFATSVEIEATRRWLEHKQDNIEYAAYLKRRRYHDDFVALIMQYRKRLDRLYGQALQSAQKRLRKYELLAQLKSDYAQMKHRWDGYAGYDSWFARPLNNAHLASVGTYHQYVPAFQALLAQSDNDLERFYVAAAQLAKLPHAKREAALALLAQVQAVQLAHSPDKPHRRP